MSEREITCINKDDGNHLNRYEGITHYGWRDEFGKTGRDGRQEMVDWVEKSNRAYVKGSGTKVYCMVVTSSQGTKFLQTYADGKETNNLLSLGECPTR
ncbi:DUF3892 domain-containing protein [Candidatus Cryosericum odellii]|jgi:hypothetical protein|uniref:DUF3892 domain-containing protein n=1 Tax=Candidatus Cryosericum odellii TaxID=2290917 RepID=A0A398D874_9BACT|nr:DUF3892 domain-containing protein [Candidatus Cryosericum odellii]RIE09660.1 DUF3892 domain-containing protein [Candidatus Cryosericum odellii]